MTFLQLLWKYFKVEKNLNSWKFKKKTRISKSEKFATLTYFRDALKLHFCCGKSWGVLTSSKITSSKTKSWSKNNWLITSLIVLGHKISGWSLFWKLGWNRLGTRKKMTFSIYLWFFDVLIGLSQCFSTQTIVSPHDPLFYSLIQCDH